MKSKRKVSLCSWYHYACVYSRAATIRRVTIRYVSRYTPCDTNTYRDTSRDKNMDISLLGKTIFLENRTWSLFFMVTDKYMYTNIVQRDRHSRLVGNYMSELYFIEQKQQLTKICQIQLLLIPRLYSTDLTHLTVQRYYFKRLYLNRRVGLLPIFI